MTEAPTPTTLIDALRQRDEAIAERDHELRVCLGALTEIEQLRAQLAAMTKERDELDAEARRLRRIPHHGVCEEERLAEVRRAADAEIERDTARAERDAMRVVVEAACAFFDEDAPCVVSNSPAELALAHAILAYRKAKP